MKRLFTVSVLIAAFAACSTALAGDAADYGGKIEKGGKIGIDTNGGQKVVDAIRFEKFPAKCNGVSGFTINATWTPGSDEPITNKEFTLNLLVDDGGDNDGSTLQMTGKLRHGGEKITGEIKSKAVFVSKGETCKTRQRDYTAKLGNDTTSGDPKAAFKVR